MVGSAGREEALRCADEALKNSADICCFVFFTQPNKSTRILSALLHTDRFSFRAGKLT